MAGLLERARTPLTVSRTDRAKAPAWWRRLAALAVKLSIGALIFLFVAEIGLRVVGLGHPYYSAPEAYLPRDDPELLFGPRPGFQGFSEGTEVVFNSAGLRDRELPFARPGGSTRILVLGDSVAFGFGVRGEETFSRLLEARLNAGPGGRYEVINAGVVGYNTVQERIMLQDLGLRYEPNLVVLVFVVNDLLDTFSIFDHQYQPTGFLAPLKIWLRRNSHVYRFYQNNMWQIVDDIRKGPNRSEPVRSRERVAKREWEIVRIAELSRQANAGFLLVLYPDNLYQQVTPDSVGRQVTVREELFEFAGLNHLEVLDLSEALGDVRDPRARYLRHREDPHPSPAGHAAIAEALYDAVSRQFAAFNR